MGEGNGSTSARWRQGSCLSFILLASVAAASAACGGFDGYTLREDAGSSASSTDSTDPALPGADAHAGTAPGLTGPDGAAPGGPAPDSGTGPGDGSPPQGELCYHDNDHDGVVGSVPTTFHGACPADWTVAPASGRYDCDDTSGLVKPGQTGFFFAPAPGGGWDYDCDTVATRDKDYGLNCAVPPGGACFKRLAVVRVDNVVVATMNDLRCGATAIYYGCETQADGSCDYGASAKVTQIGCR